MKVFLVVILGLLTTSAFASDHWDYCSSADGVFKVDSGVLYIDGLGEIASESVKLTVLSTVKKEQEKCVLEEYDTEVIAYDNTITVEELEYQVEENDEVSKEIVLCERGGSGIPANAKCKEN